MRKLEIGAVYKHFKGNLYRAEDVARHSETGETYVVYRQMYGDRRLWIRPIDMFLEEVDHEKYPDAEQKYRFELYETETNSYKTNDTEGISSDES